MEQDFGRTGDVAPFRAPPSVPYGRVRPDRSPSPVERAALRDARRVADAVPARRFRVAAYPADAAGPAAPAASGAGARHLRTTAHHGLGPRTPRGDDGPTEDRTAAVADGGFAVARPSAAFPVRPTDEPFRRIVRRLRRGVLSFED